VLQRSPAGCASLTYALDEYLTPPTMVILRGESVKLQKWRHALGQHYYPHHLFFYLDETVKALPATLQRSLTEDVNAWVCRGVECSQSVDDLSRLISQI
jgi:uncharacterized protein YyaL (SSP411 family)